MHLSNFLARTHRWYLNGMRSIFREGWQDVPAIFNLRFQDVIINNLIISKSNSRSRCFVGMIKLAINGHHAVLHAHIIYYIFKYPKYADTIILKQLGLRECYWETAKATPPIILKLLWGHLPIPVIGKELLRDWWRCSNGYSSPFSTKLSIMYPNS